MANEIPISFKQGKAVSSTNVVIAANRILEDYYGKPLETKGDKNVNSAQSKISSDQASSNATVKRLDRRDRSTVVQNACNVFDNTDVELFVENCQRLDISPVTYTHLQNILQRNESVVNLRNHGIGPIGALTVMHKLTERAKCVVELDLSSNKLGDKGTAAVCQFLEKNDSVVKVDLSRNALRKPGVDAIAHILPKNESLKNIILSHNGLTEEDFELLASVLQTEQVLETLDLSSNLFSQKSGYMFGFLVAKNISLVKMNVSCNRIGDEGIRDLVPGLIHNRTIRSLDLSWNDIADEGAMWMSEMITSNSILQDLNLSYNRITSKGVSYIADSLALNTTLKILKLSGNSLISEDAVLLLQSILKNSSMKLRHLYLGEVIICAEFQRLFQDIRNIHKHFMVWGMVGAAGQPIKLTTRSNAMEALEECFIQNKLDPITSFHE